MSRTRQFPVLVRRLFEQGESWAYYPSLESHLRKIGDAVAQHGFQPERYDVDEPCGQTRVIGFVAPDWDCPDEWGRNRQPSIAVLAVVPRTTDDSAKAAVLHDLYGLAYPSVRGANTDLSVSVPARWTIIRPVAPLPATAWWSIFFPPREPPFYGLADELIEQECERTESALFDAARESIEAFQRLCHPQSVFYASHEAIAARAADFTLEAAQKYVLDVRSPEWTLEIHFTGRLMCVAAASVERKRSELFHQFEWDDARQRLLLHSAWRLEIPGSSRLSKDELMNPVDLDVVPPVDDHDPA